jgi:type IV pilus assembly protein PilW
MNKFQKGFTIVELMVSLVLGLIISAAAIQLFYTGQKSAIMQQGGSNLLNSGYFGLDYMVRDLRLSNLDATETLIDNTVLHGGIVLVRQNISSAATFQMTNATAANTMYTAANIGPTNLNIANVGSDQLVIQYRNTVSNQFDCEGNAIGENVYVVQRYFLRRDTTNSTDEPNQPLALACTAATYTGDNIASLNLSGEGRIVVPRVDHFHVLLGVADDVMNGTDSTAVAGQDGVLDRFGYMTIAGYQALNPVAPVRKPQIVSIKLGLLVRSPNSVGKSDLIATANPFQIFDIRGPLIVHNKNDMYLRNVLTQTVVLRNGFGLEE